MKIEEYEFDQKTFLSISVDNKLTPSNLNKIEDLASNDTIGYISLNSQQTLKTWQEINRIIVTYSPAIRISLSHRDDEFDDLSFLENLPDIQELYIFLYKLKDLSPISHLKKLKVLKFFNAFQSAKVRLKPLTSLKQLEELSIFHVKDIEEITNFTSLKKLGLKSLKSDHLNFLKPLINLEKIELRSSDRITDYSGLYDLPKLSEAFIVKNYKDTTAEFVSHLKHLKKLDITDFNSVSKFPSLEKLDKLTDLSITSWKILNDISGVAKAKNLIEFSAFVGPEFKPSALTVLKGHPTLKNIRAGFNTKIEEADYETLRKEILE
ncbi:hypothetical protein H0I23_11025 [Cellulophaga sp. HaHaR_3_176]|uniref:hypothetical protein n=1 Tax=Cellulophaga sp. HaHaR_3_176 TaxID=1942464 RepID=UPI001C1F2689|nr:hypothetical protein [Cellulophaga sp. HaHaR_3_176]QWX82992.1 hypothetical protein H0I23_11025 [Cellulophaga sp. HaHaR_3_176]